MKAKPHPCKGCPAFGYPVKCLNTKGVTCQLHLGKALALLVCAIMAALLCAPPALAESYGMHKLKQVILSDYYNQRPQIQDVLFYELLLDFDGLSDDIAIRAREYARWYGELMAATPITHRYYRFLAAEYRYWSDEAERKGLNDGR